MDYKNTFFEVDPMVIYKSAGASVSRVLRLDEDFVLEFESHLAIAWQMLCDKRSFADVITYFSKQCDITDEEATKAFLKLLSTLEAQKLGQKRTL